nr:hypothetical protein [Floricoccus penangensis]
MKIILSYALSTSLFKYKSLILKVSLLSLTTRTLSLVGDLERLLLAASAVPYEFACVSDTNPSISVAICSD